MKPSLILTQRLFWSLSSIVFVLNATTSIALFTRYTNHTDAGMQKKSMYEIEYDSSIYVYIERDSIKLNKK